VTKDGYDSLGTELLKENRISRWADKFRKGGKK